MKKNLLISGTWLMAMTLAGLMVSCSKETPASKPEDNPPYQVGDVVYQRFGKEIGGNEEVLEEVSDSIVNFGTAEHPAIFPVNISHTSRGKDVAPGPEDMQCIFQSLNQEEYMDFAKVFAVTFGLSGSKDRNLSPEERQNIFIQMKERIGGLTGHPALIYYLLKSNLKDDVRVKNLLSPSASRNLGDESRSRLLEDLSQELLQNSAEELEQPQVMHSSNRGNRGEDYQRKVRPEDAANIFGGVWCPLDNAGAVANHNTYKVLEWGQEYKKDDGIFTDYRNDFMVLWIGDMLNPDHYTTDEFSQNTDTYFFYHGTKLTPLSGAKFHFHQNYAKYSNDFGAVYDVLPESGSYQSGYWTKEIQLVIEDSWRWTEQICTGYIQYAGTYLDMEAAKDGVLKPGTHSVLVLLEYGDYLLCHYKAHLKFNIVDGNMSLEYNYIDHL